MDSENSKSPTISVIMATYNEPLEYLKLSIESILNQTFKDFEFIIILDNPKNQEIENFIKKYQQKDDRIIFLKNEKNLGRGATRNRGIYIAKGKYIAIIDADDVAEETRLEKQYKFLEKNKNIDILFTWTNLIDEKGNIIGEFCPKKIEVENFEKYIFKKPIFVHPTLMIKSDVLKKLKYDEYFLNAQDFEFFIRCIKKGYKFSVLEEKLFYYRTPIGLNFKKRLNKLKSYSFFTFIALWKHKDYFYKRKDFWFKFFYSLFAWISLKIMPDKFNIFLLKKLDEKRKQK